MGVILIWEYKAKLTSRLGGYLCLLLIYPITNY